MKISDLCPDKAASRIRRPWVRERDCQRRDIVTHSFPPDLMAERRCRHRVRGHVERGGEATQRCQPLTSATSEFSSSSSVRNHGGFITSVLNSKDQVESQSPLPTEVLKLGSLSWSDKYRDSPSWGL